MKMNHEHFMRLAIEEAKKGEGTTSPYPCVGCVVVKSGRIIGRGWTQPQGSEHAEASVLKRIGNRSKGATLYSTLEPCHHNDYSESQPCSQWIRHSGIRTVVWGVRDPNPKNNEGSTRWLKKNNVRVLGRILEAECRKLHEIFLVSLQHRRPFVMLSTASSLDGKITWRKDASPVRFSSAQSLARVHRLRSTVDAIAVGSRTLQIDNPRLTARIRGVHHEPHRVIIDSSCSLPVQARVFDASQGRVIVITTAYSPLIRREELARHGAEIIVVSDDGRGRVHLPSALGQLYRRGITSLMIEGGGELIASAFASRVVDRIYFWYSPMIIGGRETPTAVEGEGLKKFSDAIRLKDVHWESVGDDVLVTATPQYR